jgi:hypothetical protein
MSSCLLTNCRAFGVVQAPSLQDIFPAQLDFAGVARWFQHRGVGRAKKGERLVFFSRTAHQECRNQARRPPKSARALAYLGFSSLGRAASAFGAASCFGAA